MRYLKLIIWTLLLVLATSAGNFSLAQNSNNSEEVAPISSSVTGIIKKVCIKPEKGDSLPLTAFAMLNELDNRLTMILLPANSAEQDELIRDVLEVCVAEEMRVTISGNLITQTNKAGSKKYIVIYELQVRTANQVLIMQWPKN